MPPPLPETPSWQRAARVVLALLLLGLGLYVVENFVHALLWGAILVVATWPLYRRAGRYIGPGKHNILLPALFTAGTTLIVVVPLILLAIQVGREAGTVSHYVQDIRANGAPVPAMLGKLPVGQAQATAWWQDNLADPEGAKALLGRFDRSRLVDMGRGFGSRVLRGGVTFVFTLMTMFFLYRDGRTLREQLLTASRRLFGPSGERVGRQIVASIHGTVDGLVLVGLGEGVLIGVAYVIAGVDHPALLGAATAVGAMVPLGATLVLAVAGLLLLVAGKTVGAIAVVVFGLVVVFIADHFIRPALIGGATRLPFIWVLLGILGGVESFGLLGLFLGPAIMAALILLWREWVGDATTDQAAPPAPPAPLPPPPAAVPPPSPVLDA